MTLNLESGIPVVFGVITTDTIEQAIERAGTKAGNKGFDAGMAALEMVSLCRTLKVEMASRRRAREFALQALYQWDLVKSDLQSTLNGCGRLTGRGRY